MSWVDLVIVGIVLVSVFISLVRGFVREALSLVGWVIAFWVSLSFSTRFAQLFTTAIQDPTFRLIAAFSSLFVLTLLASMVANFFAGQLVKRTGLTNVDRFAGVIFGFMRGVLLVSVLVLLAGLTALPKIAWWENSLLMSNFETIALWLSDFLPSDVAKNFKY